MPSAVIAAARKKIVMVRVLHVGAGDAALALALKIIRRRARLGWVAFGGNSPRPRDGGQRRASAVAEEPAVAAACVIYVIDDGEPAMVRKLGDGGEELRKVATAGYYVGGLGPLSRFPAWMGNLGISPHRIPGVRSLCAAEVMCADSTGLPVRVARPPLRYGTMSERPPATGNLNSLLRRVAQHDVDAFAEFYDLTSSRVLGLVARVLRDPGYSEETTQEVYLQVWRNAGNYDPAAGSALAWVLTLAHRRAVDRVRAEQAAAQREFRYGSASADRPADVVADSAILREERRQVAECLDTLTDAQRECIELAYYGGLTYAQVSERLSANLATIKSRMRDALRGLKNCLGVIDRGNSFPS